MGVKFHFLNVGSGDCTIVHFPERMRKDGKEKNERIMMVDLYHHDDNQEYENVIDYYKKHFKNSDGSIKPIFRFVCTHPHQDHICGLKEFCDDMDIKIFNFWDLKHSFEPEDFEHHPTHKDDWDAYGILRGGNSPATVILTTREDAPMQFWNDDEDRITILSPSESLIENAHYKEDGTKRNSHNVEIDEMSYTLMIKVNERKIILAGDGHATPHWDDIYNNCKSKIGGCAILKAGHHGHELSFHEEAVKLMNPVLIIFSNSKDQDKENGAYNLYKKAVPNALILKTWENGSVVVDVPFDSSEKITYSTSK
jgi:competence protein ComEC